MDKIEGAIESAERVYPPQNSMWIEGMALTEEAVKTEGNTTTGILTTVTGILRGY